MSEDTKQTYQFGRFCLDTSEQTLLLDRKPVPLPPKVLDTLTILVKRGGHVVSKDEIMAAVWGDTFVEESSLTRNISLLRKALQEGTTEKYIETVPKRGYRFVAPVRLVDVDESSAEGTMDQGNGHHPQVFRLEPRNLVYGEKPSMIVIPASPTLLKRQWFFAGLIVLITLSLVVGFVWRASNNGSVRRFRPIRDQPTGNDNRSTASVEAYRHYRIGQHFWGKRGKSNTAKAIQYFRLATEQDPNNALAFSSLSDSYLIEAFHGYGNFSLQEAYDKGKQAADQAMQLDNSLPEAHVATGLVKEFEGDLTGAEHSFRYALELNPSSPLAHFRYSHLLASTSRLSEAIAELRTAHELDPVSSVICGVLGNHLLLARQYDDAIKYHQLALELDPENYSARDGLGWAYAGNGMYANAMNEFNVLAQAPDFDLAAAAGVSYVDSRTGRLREARQRLAQIIMENEKAPQRSYFWTSLQIAKVFCALGDKENAFVWIHHASPLGRLNPYHFEYGAELEPLRTDPRFAQPTAEARNSRPPVTVIAQKTD